MYPPEWLKITVLFLFLIVIPFATSLSFNFTSFDPNADNITYELNAHAINNVIQLTQPDPLDTTGGSTGRIDYGQPFHLWDKASGYLANFSTNFSFSSSITNYAGPKPGGSMLSFFLVPNGTNGTSIITTYVAVEFGMPSNASDTIFNGTIVIDINNSRTEMTLPLEEGWNHDVWISYDSNSKNLIVVCTGLGLVNQTQINGRMSRVVDLGFHLPEFVTLGFSAWSYSYFVIRNIEIIRSWSFMSSTLELKTVNQTDTQELTTPVNQTTTPVLNSRKSNNNSGLLIGLAIGVTAFVLLMGLLTYCFRSKVKMTVNGVGSIRVPFDDELEQGSGPKQFAYKDLKQATNNFAQENKLGEGGFGGVYKGSLSKIGLLTAVKRVSSDSKQGIKEYQSEVKVISRLRHRNLVKLLGWCHEKNELLLAYEFLPQGSLDLHLFTGRSLLSWGMRYKIAQGLAAALLYLHEEWDQCVLHRDIKSSNIMLDANFNTKLGDFGLARLVDHEKESQTTIMAGTLGYMAPECAITGKSSKETDVFSFGVVALEIASGRRPMYLEVKQGRPNLIEWVWSLYGTEKLLDAADPRLGKEFDSRELEQLLIVGLCCVHPNSDARPSIRQAVLVLNFEAPLPILPLKMPVARYYTSESDVLLPNGTNNQLLLSDITDVSSICTVSGTSSS